MWREKADLPRRTQRNIICPQYSLDISFLPVENIDPEEKLHQLRETYEQMTEDELCAVADDAYDLTPQAREILQAIISERHLDIQLTAALPAPPDNDLVVLCPVWDESEARFIQNLLDAKSIKSYLGPDNVELVEDFQGQFETGVDIKVAAIDRDRAMAVIDFEPQGDEEEDEQGPAGDEEGRIVSCPKCQSLDVNLDRDPQAPPDGAHFNWRCNACGNRWQDEVSSAAAK